MHDHVRPAARSHDVIQTTAPKSACAAGGARVSFEVVTLWPLTAGTHRSRHVIADGGARDRTGPLQRRRPERRRPKQADSGGPQDTWPARRVRERRDSCSSNDRKRPNCAAPDRTNTRTAGRREPVRRRRRGRLTRSDCPTSPAVTNCRRRGTAALGYCDANRSDRKCLPKFTRKPRNGRRNPVGAATKLPRAAQLSSCLWACRL